MRSPAPTVAEIRGAIRSSFERGTKRIDRVAEELHISRSTLQRRLCDQGLTFSALRQEVQISIALDLLTSGTSARTVARRLELHPDHLCVLVRRDTGLTPRKILRAAVLSSRIERMRSQVPPDSRSSGYRRQLQRWRLIDAELDRLLGELGPENPLAPWAKKVLLAAARPDFRRQPYRDRVREQRRREAEEIEEIYRAAERRLANRPSPFEGLRPIFEAADAA